MESKTIPAMEIIVLLGKSTSERLTWLASHILKERGTPYGRYLSENYKSMMQGYDRIIKNLFPEVELHIARNLLEYYLGKVRRTGVADRRRQWRRRRRRNA